MHLPSKDSIKDQVYEIIKAKILDQTYGFGDKININSLSKELNVSNTPIREAINMLKQDGLTEINQYAGPRVIEMNKANFKEVIETTRVLMIGGYDLCVRKNMVPQLVALMKERLAEQEHIAEKGSDQAFARAVVAFEECVLTVPENAKLRAMYRPVFDLLYLIVLYDHQHSGIARGVNIEHHKRILQAVESNGYQDVVELLRGPYMKNIPLPSNDQSSE